MRNLLISHLRRGGVFREIFAGGPYLPAVGKCGAFDLRGEVCERSSARLPPSRVALGVEAGDHDNPFRLHFKEYPERKSSHTSAPPSAMND
jgi:hypothetical protein